MFRTIPPTESILLLIALPGLILLAGCGGGSGDEDVPTGPPPSILLIVADTLRADRLGSYGYGRPTSPALDRLAEGAVRYDRAHATSPWTLPSHASLFTGLYPFQHGVHTLESGGPSDGEPVRPLARRFTTLAEVLGEEGYETAAFCANFAYLSPRYQLDQGFETYEIRRGWAGDVNERVIGWLRERSARREERPFFLFVNYMDTHTPYNTSPRPDFLDGMTPAYSKMRMERLYRTVVAQTGEAAEEDLRILGDQYDLAIANLDDEIANLFQELIGLGLYHDMMIVVTSDHGEFLGEHGLLEHSKDVYEPVLRIPLIVKEPRQTEGRTEDRLVSLVHVPRMILSAAGLDDDPRWRDLFPYAGPQSAILAENHFTRQKDLKAPWGDRFRRIRKVVIEGERKYIDSSDGNDELYDLATDGTESSNLLDGDPASAKPLAELLGRQRTVRVFEGGAKALGPLSDEEKRRLQELGYFDDE